MLDLAQIPRQVSLPHSTHLFLIHLNPNTGVFLTSANDVSGPITTFHRDTRLVKTIPWTVIQAVTSQLPLSD
jgi:hypothetical protein